MAILAVTAIVRLIACSFVPLIPEEAYYWMYARHPSLSYFDHPPMVAWVIRIGTAIFGQTETGVRFVGSVLALAAPALMYWMARLWVNRRASLIAAAALLLLPVYVWTGFINTMNSQLLFFWLLSLYGASLALRRDHSIGWYIAGVGMGGAMLSKYTGVFVGGGIGLALLMYRPWWRRLYSPHLYLGAALGVLMFAPVLLWNERNGWASFRFQFVDRTEAHPLNSWWTLWSTVCFVLLQSVAVTPLLFALWAQTFRRRQHWLGRLLGQPLVVFSAATSFPLLAAMAWKSILFDVHFDWTAPAYLSVLPLAAQTLAARWRINRREPAEVAVGHIAAARFWDRMIGLTIGACAAGNIGCLLFLLLIQPHTGRPAVFGPWRPLAKVVDRYEHAVEDQTKREPLIVGRGKYRLASELAFYREPLELPSSSSDFTTSEWFLGDVQGLGFAYWFNRSGWLGRDCIFVTDKDDIAAVVSDRFDRVQLVDDPALRALPGGVTYHIAICYGFRG
ncbi:MAG: glycosyltransferase family 39 protein [Phycisphaerae bacterium]|nr:glycosyltransferase family 39 protein [Phycisphaerae bacterium]